VNFDFKLAGRRMRTLLLLMMLILLGGTGLVRAEGRPDFTAQELQWIQQHPTVTYTVKELWPQEYEENGRHVGLSRDFLDDIEQQTGIHFVYVPAGDKSAAPPMMISSVLESLLSPQEKKGWLFTSDWISAIPMLIARNETKHVRNLSGLAGRTLAVIQGGEYEGWLRLNYPQVKLLPVNSAKEALQAVEDNRADAALGSGLIMLPIYQRLYYHTLSIASQLPELASGIHMAVADNYPELQGIINKALDNLTARDIQSTYLKWFTVMDIGTPTVGVLVQYYWWQILLFSVLLILLIWAIRNALLAKRRAQRSEAEKSAFLAMMSHEIRTPMNALVASLELLRHSSTKSKQLEYTDLAFSSSQNLLGLLNDVLDHSKLSHMHPQLERHSMDIGELLNAVCESQRPSAEKKGLRLNLELQANLPGYWIVADSHRLRQIVNNLLSNAIKFTEQGSITLEARLEKSSADGQDHLTVDILDTGIGIPDEAKRRLFIAWYQAESFTARHYGGSGLGLYICNELVNAMQGRLSMESQVGKGSRFTFTVPVEPYGLTNSTQPMAEPVLPRFNHQISVLVVEDHPANQQVIAGQLDMLQCHYEMASEGEAAMNLLEDENYYDLILLDCNLPGRDGYQLTEDIRQLEQQRQLERTPIIAISALNSQAHYARCKLSGMDDVMTKPIVLPELADVLVKWCPEAASRAQYEMRQEPELTLQPAMKSWLMQDLADFRRAAEAEDLRFMTYSIHRIKGVAQMYHLPDLAEYSADIERQLHEAKGDENWPLAEWLQRLHQLIKQSEDH
jgi:two-component system sensor histidine kinase EvgS